MKKFVSIVTAIIISISLVACGTKNTNSAPISEITYTKELTYFPSFNGSELSEFTPGTKEAPFATAKYTIKNVDDKKVYEYYESALKKDGWTITEGKEHFSISAKKDDHLANIIIQQSNKDVILVVISK